ncbi:MAG: YdeI/OmpD-associated family protein [Thermoplasmatota archaeon]
MDRPETLYVYERSEWRSWLQENFLKKKEIWLIYPRKSSGKPRIPYNDAVEEALCFGWIDSTGKTMDDGQYMQRFTPRKPRSSYSQANKERLKWLLEKDMIHPSMADTVRTVLEEEFVFPTDIIDEIRSDDDAWENYNNFSESYKRIRIAYIDSARNRPEEFEKRLRNFIDKTKKNKMIGFGGIDKYY